MNLPGRRKLVIGVVAGAVAAGAGGAIAATQFGSSRIDSQAVIDDAAQQLGVDPSKLSDALRSALAKQIDALVAAGKLSKEQGDELKARIQSAQTPLFGGPRGLGGFGFRHFGGFAELDAAAAYLGLSADDLRTQLQSGKTLAQVAQDQGKSVDGLVSALVDAAKKKLDAAVSANRLTQAQEDQIVSDLKQRLTDVVNGVHGGPPGFGRGFRFGGDHLRGVRPDFRPAFRGPTA